MGTFRASFALAFLLILVVAISAANAARGWMQEGAVGGTGGSLIGVNPNCPNVIMESGGQIHLYNTRKAKVPGVNPITLSSINDYPQLMAFLNAKGMNCPALFLREGRNAQGEIDMEQLVVNTDGQMVPLWRRPGFGPPRLSSM